MSDAWITYVIKLISCLNGSSIQWQFVAHSLAVKKTWNVFFLNIFGIHPFFLKFVCWKKKKIMKGTYTHKNHSLQKAHYRKTNLSK